MIWHIQLPKKITTILVLLEGQAIFAKDARLSTCAFRTILINKSVLGQVSTNVGLTKIPEAQISKNLVLESFHKLVVKVYEYVAYLSEP